VTSLPSCAPGRDIRMACRLSEQIDVHGGCRGPDPGIVLSFLQNRFTQASSGWEADGGPGVCMVAPGPSPDRQVQVPPGPSPRSGVGSHQPPFTNGGMILDAAVALGYNFRAEIGFFGRITLRQDPESRAVFRLIIHRAFLFVRRSHQQARPTPGVIASRFTMWRLLWLRINRSCR